MKLQCDLCREIVVAELAIDAAAGVVRVHCPACDGRFSVEATAEPDRGKGKDTDTGKGKGKGRETGGRDGEMVCPKCGTAQRPADACRACGLRAAKMPEFADRADDDAPELAAAWTACEGAWSDAALHDRLAELVASHSAYAWAARRYRAVLRDRPDDAMAGERLARLTRLTEASLRAGAAARPAGGGDPAKSYGKVALVLLALVLLAAAGALIAMMSSRTPAR